MTCSGFPAFERIPIRNEVCGIERTYVQIYVHTYTCIHPLCPFFDKRIESSTHRRRKAKYRRRNNVCPLSPNRFCGIANSFSRS